MKKVKMERGITLVALIITIVVLLILAVVTISSIQESGLISYANNTANLYEQEQKKEGQHLSGYEGVLSEYSNSISGLGTTIREGVSITLKDKDGVDHDFYVLEKGDTTVKLLAKKCINTSTLTQSSPNPVAFSTTNYWSGIEEWNYNLTGVNEADIALKAASDYGNKFEGATGRLLYLDDRYSSISEIDWYLQQAYWSATTVGDDCLFSISMESGEGSALYSDLLYVRPVVFVPTSALS